MAEWLTVLTTIDSPEKAEALARGAVRERVAACAQVSGPVTSVYRWQGQVETASEWQVLFKTTAARYEALEAHLRAAHDYETPEIIATPVVRGDAAYLRWMEDETAPGTRAGNRDRNGNRDRTRNGDRSGQGDRRGHGGGRMSGGTERLPVFVYGTLRPGGLYHPSYLLGRTTAEEPATLSGVVLHEGPGYPYALEEDAADVEPGVVRGELMTLAEDGYERVLAALDQLEEYRPGDPASLYLRAVREVTRTRDGARVPAWVYLAAPRLAARLRAEGRVIAGGDWFTR